MLGGIQRKIKNPILRAAARAIRRYFFLSLNTALGIPSGFLKMRQGPIESRIASGPGAYKMLIIRTNRTGDVILTTPVFRALKESFPKSSVSVLVHRDTKAVIENNRFIDKIYASRHRGFRIFLKEQALIRSLRKEKFDLVFVMHPSQWCNLLSFIIKPRQSIGFDCYGSGWLLDKSVPYIYHEHRYSRLISFEIEHEVDYNLRLTRIVGADTRDKRPFIDVPDEAIRKMKDFLKDEKVTERDRIAVIHPGSAEPYLRWRKEGFCFVADRLMQEGIKVIIIEGPKEEKIVADIVTKMGKRPIIARGFSLLEVAGLIKQCGLFLGNSTGTAHIASALNVPTVTIMGIKHPSDSYLRWRPLGEKSVVLQNDVGCKKCYPAECRGYPCIATVDEDEVLRSCLRLLEKK